MNFQLASSSWKGLTPDKVQPCGSSYYPDTDDYKCFAKKASSGPSPTAAPFASSSWRLVGKNVYGSVKSGSNQFTPYVFGKAEDITACSQHCNDLHRCIGFTFRADSYCYLWLSNPTYSMGFYGWYLSTSGVRGLIPSKLQAGSTQSSALGLVTYAQLTHKLSSGIEEEDMETSVPNDATESPIFGFEGVPKDDVPEYIAPGTEGLEVKDISAKSEREGALLRIANSGDSEELQSAMAEEVLSHNSDSEGTVESQNVHDLLLAE